MSGTTESFTNQTICIWYRAGKSELKTHVKRLELILKKTEIKLCKHNHHKRQVASLMLTPQLLPASCQPVPPWSAWLPVESRLNLNKGIFWLIATAELSRINKKSQMHLVAHVLRKITVFLSGRTDFFRSSYGDYVVHLPFLSGFTDVTVWYEHFVKQVGAVQTFTCKKTKHLNQWASTHPGYFL